MGVAHRILSTEDETTTRSQCLMQDFCLRQSFSHMSFWNVIPQ